MSWWKSLAKWAGEQAIKWGVKKIEEKATPIKRTKRNRA